jgi:glycine/D-amino acid oxidase-like deaminating enzyme
VVEAIMARISIKTPVVFQDAVPEAAEVVIVGGGVIGVFTALYLARLGKSVFLCEKGRIAGEQSSRNWGWIRQHGRDEAELPIMMRSLDLWHEANAQTNGTCGIVTTGINYLAATNEKMAVNEQWLDIARRHGLHSELMTAKQVSDSFSGKSNDRWVGGVSTPGDAKGEPWQAVPAVAKLVRQAGGKIRENCAVRAFDVSGGDITGVITEAGAIRCEQVVLAAGAWSSLLARFHGLSLPQLSVRATVAQTEPMPGFTTASSRDEGLAIRPRDDGGYSLAITDGIDCYLGPDVFRHAFAYRSAALEYLWDIKPFPAAPSGFPDSWSTARNPEHPSVFERTRVLEPAPNKGFVRKMQKRFADRFPGVGAPVIKDSWAGMIDAMPDIVPVVDRAPDLPGLIIATGMSGHGFGIGPGFAEVIARMVSGNEPEYDLNRFRLNRFRDGSKLELGPAL